MHEASKILNITNPILKLGGKNGEKRTKAKQVLDTEI